MERAAWTDERLDDLAEAMRAGFARLDGDIRDLRTEVRELRTEMHSEISELRQLVFRTAVATNVALVGVIAAILGTAA